MACRSPELLPQSVCTLVVSGESSEKSEALTIRPSQAIEIAPKRDVTSQESRALIGTSQQTEGTRAKLFQILPLFNYVNI